ncbi:MAG: pseudouridine synthase [candidate division FCPU426 bacterium]
MSERLQKFLSSAGIASRRQAEKLMLEGRVTVNGKVANELGVKIDPRADAVKVDGKLVRSEKLYYVLLNKPKGTICTMDDPEGRPKVSDLVRGVKARLYPVGRLDFDTTGALLLTNDGELANMLMHPQHRFAKTYVAKLKGIPTPENIEKMKTGIYIDGKRTAPAEAKLMGVKEKNSVLQITLREGRNKQVKRMCQAIGHPVIRLNRLAYGFLTVNELAPGAWRHLMVEEVELLKKAAIEGGRKAPEDPRLLRKPRPPQPRKPRIKA